MYSPASSQLIFAYNHDVLDTHPFIHNILKIYEDIKKNLQIKTNIYFSVFFSKFNAGF